MTTLQIGEVARRSGVSAPTLRYYEDLGLLPQVQRTASGYRTYDEAVLARLTFITRAKSLGCTLEEVAALVGVWEGGACGPVQDRLRTHVTEKLADARHRIVELVTFSEELQRAAAAFDRHRPDGPCDDACGCVSVAPTTPAPQPVALGTKPSIACTLPASQMGGRLDDWTAVLHHVDRREPIDGGVRLRLSSETPLADLARLMVAEQACCPFFSFSLVVDTRGTSLEVRAPEDALAMVHTVFGVAA